MFRQFIFVLRMAIAWSLAILAVLYVLAVTIGDNRALPPFMLLGLVILVFAVLGALSYLLRMRLIHGKACSEALGNRQKRRIEIPYEIDDAFELIGNVIRDLPRTEAVESIRDSLQIYARMGRPDLYGGSWLGRLNPVKWFSHMHNQILATVTPGDGTSSVSLLFEPVANAWTDWFLVDGGTNLENAEAITRALTRRIAERRRDEQRAATQTATEKELSEARLGLLHAQIEPHFLYNTLASAQLLTRSDPEQADRMLGHLIRYLRHSLPRMGESQSTLGQELERIRAYLEILCVRMGDRLQWKIEVPEALHELSIPSMVLQPLVENAIKHGLEPKPRGGTIWILGRRDDDRLAITIGDDGAGFGAIQGGTGIGLKNIRERLRLQYGDHASLSVVANVPEGVSATLTLPVARDTWENPSDPQPEASHD